jgi:hypothetical protein
LEFISLLGAHLGKHTFGTDLQGAGGYGVSPLDLPHLQYLRHQHALMNNGGHIAYSRSIMGREVPQKSTTEGSALEHVAAIARSEKIYTAIYPDGNLQADEGC